MVDAKNTAQSHEFAESVINAVREPLICLDQDLRVVAASRSFYQFFKVKPEETVGQRIYDLGNNQWDIPKLRELLETILPQKATFDDYEVEHDFTTIGRRTMLLNARQIVRTLGKERIILLAIEDITERKRLETQLSESEERYRRLFETANDGILLLEKRQMKIHHANPAITAMLGYSTEECLGREMKDIGILKDIGSCEEVVQVLDKDGIINYRDVPVQTKAGQVVDTDIYLVDRARLIQCNIRDITDNKQTEKKLRKSEDHLRTLVQTIPDLIWSKNKEGVYLSCNPMFERFFGAKEEDIIGKTDYAFVDQNLADSFVENDRRAMAARRPTSNEEWVTFADDGHRALLETIKTPLYDDKGTLIGVLGIGRDITARKQAENNLRMAHEKLLTILDSIDSTVYVADMNTYEILFMNHKMITDFGGNKTGDICHSAFRKNSKPCECCTNDQLIDKDGNPAGVRIWHDKNPVTGRYYINHDRAIEWTDGRLVRMQIATDITDLKIMEDQLQQAQKMEAIGTLAGGIAHDFNNILGAILGYAEMAQEDSPAGSILRQDIDQIVKASHRARELVKQILAFSRQAETERILLQPAIITKEAIGMLRSSLPSTIDIKQNVDMDTGLILASPTQIHQIVMNLGTNAFHAMEDTGGTLVISLEKKTLNERDIVDKPGVQPGDFVQLSVGDTGPGIEPELWDKIFDPYFTTKEVGKGTGMGLAIIHGIVKRYGGWVSFNSQPGKGTVFQVLLPVMAEEAVVENKSEETVQFGNERILFIDDDEILAEMGKSMLERLGYQVTVQSSSLDALTTFQNQPDTFDLVITDQTMPGMTGADMARRMLQIRPGMPIILCTGYSSLISKDKAKSLGIKGFTMKPLTRKSIAVLIREVLD